MRKKKLCLKGNLSHLKPHNMSKGLKLIKSSLELDGVAKEHGREKKCFFTPAFHSKARKVQISILLMNVFCSLSPPLHYDLGL